MEKDKLYGLIEDLLVILGNKTRLNILDVVYENNGKINMSELMNKMNLNCSLPNISYHVKQMKNVKLIEIAKNGRNKYLKVNDESISLLEAIQTFILKLNN